MKQISQVLHESGTGIFTQHSALSTYKSGGVNVLATGKNIEKQKINLLATVS
jgi:hypothetical protein